MEISKQTTSNNQFINIMTAITDFQLPVVSVTDIAEILSYVKPEEQRPYMATISAKSVVGNILCKSPDYTVKPVDYLSSSELMVSTAQLGHILIDYMVRQKNFPYKDILSHENLIRMRENHEIYFTTMEFSFRHKIPAKEYRLEMSLDGLRLFHSLIIASFNFNIGNDCIGSFRATVNTKL